MRERMTRPLHKSQHKGRGKLRLVAAPGARISEELATVDGTCRRFPLCGPDLHDAGSAAADTATRSEISTKGTFELRDLFGPHLNRQPYPRRRPCATKLLKKM